MSQLTRSPAWQALQNHRQSLTQFSLRQAFVSDPQRFERFSMRLDDMLLDYSKNLISHDTMPLLFALARQAKVELWATIRARPWASSSSGRMDVVRISYMGPE